MQSGRPTCRKRRRPCPVDPVLDGDGNLHEDVVLRLRFDPHFELLHLQAQRAHQRVDERRFDVQARSRDARELPEPLDDARVRRLNGEESAEEYGQYDSATMNTPAMTKVAMEPPGFDISATAILIGV